MEAATEDLRESSPRTASRPKLIRQSSVEMQQAVDVPRPLNSERKKSTSLCIPVDTHTMAGSNEEIEMEIELSSEQIDCQTKNDTFGGLETDSNTDTWKNSAKENSDEDAPENEPQQLSLEAPSYSSIASKPKPTMFEDENIPEPPKIIEAKCPIKETIIFVEEKGSEGEFDEDEEGFEVAITRKHKRERKSSKRLSQSCDEVQISKSEDIQHEESQSCDEVQIINVEDTQHKESQSCDEVQISNVEYTQNCEDFETVAAQVIDETTDDIKEIE